MFKKKESKLKVKEEVVDLPEEEVSPVVEPERLTPKVDKIEASIEAPVKVKSSEDYLRPYQYKKVNDRIQTGGALTDPDKGSKAEVMKKNLLLQDKVKVLIQVESGSDPKVPFTVNLNGYRLDLPRNTYLEVPQQVAEVIMTSQQQTLAALDQFKISRNRDIESALG